MAKAKYDTERLLNDVIIMFKANLNNKITEINLEKQTLTDETEDNFDIELIADGAWYMNHVPKIWSETQFIVYGVLRSEALEVQNDAFVEKTDIIFEVAIPDDGSSDNESYIYKLLRYSRAMSEVAKENFDSIRSYGKLTVTSLTPATIEADGKLLKVAGIVVSASIG